VVSPAAHRSAVSALASYNALRAPRQRMARRAVATAMRVGLTGLLATRIDVGVADGATADQLTGVLLTDYLRSMFGCAQIVVAIGGGSGPYRKPVLQVFGADGAPLGYVKVGWNGWSRAAVRREAAALAACADTDLKLGVPALMNQRQWRGLDLMVTAPLPAGVRRMRTPQLPPVALLREITEIFPGHAGELVASPWWQGVRTRIAALAEPSGTGSWLAPVADRIEAEQGQTQLAFGGWHGDLVPWNLARLDHAWPRGKRLGSRVYAWDWESSAADAPVGFDALHFYFQVAFVQRREPLEQAAALAASQAVPALRDLGVPEAARPLLARLHLLELAIRHEEARASTGDCDARFYPAISQRLRATGSASAGRSDSVGLAAS